jgi:hypothetical protein
MVKAMVWDKIIDHPTKSIKLIIPVEKKYLIPETETRLY